MSALYCIVYTIDFRYHIDFAACYVIKMAEVDETTAQSTCTLQAQGTYQLQSSTGWTSPYGSVPLAIPNDTTYKADSNTLHQLEGIIYLILHSV